MGLGDSWHKVTVYFGISDDEEYDDEETLAPHEELERSYQDRPNVRKLSRGSRGRQPTTTTSSPTSRAARPQRAGVVRAIEAPRPQRVEVHLVIPKNFNDAQQIADKFKVDIPVIVNLQGSDTDLAKRLIDFAQRPHLRARRRHAAGGRQGLPAHAAQRRGLGRGARPADREGLLQSVLT